MIHGIGHVLLSDGFDGQAQLVADGLAGVPGIGGLKRIGMGDLRLEFVQGQVAAVRLGQGQAVVLNVIAVGALDLFDAVAASGHHSHHIDPEGILHAGAGNGAAVFLGQRIQLVDHGGGSGPGVNGLLAGGDDVNAAQHALFHVIVDVSNEAEEGDDGHIRRTFVEHLVRVIGNDHAGLYAKAREVAYILAHHGGVYINGTYDLRAMLIEVAKNILAHLAAAILYNLDLFHEGNLLVILLTIV